MKARQRTSYSQAVLHALKRDAKMTASQFKWVVTVVHHDHTSCTFHSAKPELFGKWLIVFTEHNGFHIFYAGDHEDLKWRRFKMLA